MTVNITALGFALAAIALVAAYALKYGGPPTPSGLRVRAALLALIDVPENALVVELGAGWGSLTLPLARKFPNALVIGYEISPLPWAVSRMRQAAARSGNLNHHRDDFFTADLSAADLVICYLQPAAMEKLKTKLERELKPPARVITHTFRLSGWTPQKTIEANDIYRTPIYVYQFGQPDG